MTPVVHIVPGWSVAQVAEAHPDGVVVRCTEDVSLGPCRFEEPVHTLQFLFRRVRWLEAFLGVDDLAEEAGADAEALAAAFGAVAARGGVLWTSDVAHEQLGLCWELATVFALAEGEPRVSVARGASHPHHRSVSQLDPREVVAVAPHVLTAPEVVRAVDLWHAWVEPTPERFADLARALRGDALFGHVWCLLNRFPGARDGLTGWERRLMQRFAEAEGERTAYTVGHVMVEGVDDDADVVGTLFLFARLRELARQGLLEQTGAGFLSKTSFTLTDLGRRILQGEVNRLDVASLERWVGGTHLSDGSPLWVLDGDTLRQR